MKKAPEKQHKTFLDLFFQTTENYSVVIVDDDEYFKKLLIQSIVDHASNLKILYHAKIKVYSYNSADSFLDSFYSHQFDGTRTVFFIDYFLEKNRNATHILRSIKGAPNHRAVILSEIKNYLTSEESLLLGADQFLRKDQFTTFMCTTLLEQFIQEDAASY